MEDPKIIAAIVAAISALIVVVFRDVLWYFIKDNLQTKRLKKRTFQKYAIPLTNSIETLSRRLHEILNFRSNFLRLDAPQNKFNKYKYISTIYRFMSVMGWLRAFKLEFESTGNKSNRDYKPIQDAINRIQSKLADGQKLELKFLENLAKSLGYNLDSLNDEKRKALAIILEQQLFKFLNLKDKSLAEELTYSDKLDFALKLSNLIAEHTGVIPLTVESIRSKLSETISEVSIVEFYIYRDWQDAIGDFMLLAPGENTDVYKVKSFSFVEEEFNSENPNKWLSRSSKLFENVDLYDKKIVDSRVDLISGLQEELINFLNIVNQSNYAKNIVDQTLLTKLNKKSVV